ncbi:MAG: hypothetical protein EZS28_036314 [Streblomastix strix]|uniref:Uncharacterized protein n=1 Tax=Streblomastix strix TaxID=222440 RepID=A0A5J4UD79_9EUKA|nr:MAG: hypothetical protein EZS28_036314 [Streblomastix strix]
MQEKQHLKQIVFCLMRKEEIVLEKVKEKKQLKETMMGNYLSVNEEIQMMKQKEKEMLIIWEIIRLKVKVEMDLIVIAIIDQCPMYLSIIIPQEKKQNLFKKKVLVLLEKEVFHQLEMKQRKWNLECFKIEIAVEKFQKNKKMDLIVTIIIIIIIIIDITKTAATNVKFEIVKEILMKGIMEQEKKEEKISAVTADIELLRGELDDQGMGDKERYQEGDDKERYQDGDDEFQ